MRTHGAAARRGKSVGLARLRILGRPTASLSIPTHFRTRKKKQDNKEGPVPALLPERGPAGRLQSPETIRLNRDGPPWCMRRPVLIEEAWVARP